MINDSVLQPSDRPPDGALSAANRREHERIPCPGEILVRWLHDPDTPTRFSVLDVSDGGFHIRAGMPLLLGMTGVVTRWLPEGAPLNRCVSVAWMDGAKGEAGLKYIGGRHAA